MKKVDEDLDDKLKEITYLIGKKIVKPSIIEHSKKLKGDFNSVESLKTIDSKKFLLSCNQALISFMQGCTGLNLDFIHDSKILYRYAVTIECLYHLQSSNIVLPHSFLMNLIQRHITGSKMATSVHGKLLPGSEDNSMREWWEHQGSEPLSVFSSADISVWFDNIGKYIEKAFRVKGDRNKTPTVITATQTIELSSIPGQSALQMTTDSYRKLEDLTEGGFN